MSPWRKPPVSGSKGQDNPPRALASSLKRRWHVIKPGPTQLMIPALTTQNLGITKQGMDEQGVNARIARQPFDHMSTNGKKSERM